MLKLHTPKSFLRYGRNMTVAEFKNVTPQDLIDYTAEYHTDIHPSKEADDQVVLDVNNSLIQNAVDVYGESSKQVKYLSRNFRGGESKVEIHYNQFPSPQEIERWVENSKTGIYEDGCVPAFNYIKREDMING